MPPMGYSGGGEADIGEAADSSIGGNKRLFDQSGGQVVELITCPVLPPRPTELESNEWSGMEVWTTAASLMHDTGEMIMHD